MRKVNQLLMPIVALMDVLMPMGPAVFCFVECCCFAAHLLLLLLVTPDRLAPGRFFLFQKILMKAKHVVV